MGSSAIAASIAHVAFWALLVFGFAFDELNRTKIAIFVVLWLAGLIGLPHVPYEPLRALFSSFVAILDIALVFIIFKGDVKLR